MQEDAEYEAQPEEPSEIPIAIPAICVAEYRLATIDVKVLMEERLSKRDAEKSSINDSYRDCQLDDKERVNLYHKSLSSSELQVG